MRVRRQDQLHRWIVLQILLPVHSSKFFDYFRGRSVLHCNVDATGGQRSDFRTPDFVCGPVQFLARAAAVRAALAAIAPPLFDERLEFASRADVVQGLVMEAHTSVRRQLLQELQLTRCTQSKDVDVGWGLAAGGQVDLPHVCRRQPDNLEKTDKAPDIVLANFP